MQAHGEGEATAKQALATWERQAFWMRVAGGPRSARGGHDVHDVQCR